MKVLFVTYHYLHGSGGGVFASRGYINAFAALSERMTLLCPVKDGRHPEGIDPSIHRTEVPYDKPVFWKFVDLLFGKIHRYHGVYEKTLLSGDYDTVVFDACYVSFGLIGKAHKAGCRVITIHHNYQCDYVRDNYVFPLRLPMLFWTRLSERAAVRKSDLNFVLTVEDKALLEEHYAPCAPIRVLGVFEYERKNPPRTVASVQDPVFIVTGNLGMLQTEVPLMEWIDSCYAVLREEVPDASVVVAGKNPSNRLTARCLDHDIEVFPNPLDMQDVLNHGKYYLCPASMGGGLKLRMMDGLKNGMPVLAHVDAARGYERFVDRSVFCYRDEDSFRDALRRMLDANPDRAEMARVYQEEFSFDAGVERLRSLL